MVTCFIIYAIHMVVRFASLFLFKNDDSQLQQCLQKVGPTQVEDNGAINGLNR